MITTEREMPTGQRNLVESNFEEGNYERGIYILNELLMEDVRPPKYVLSFASDQAGAATYLPQEYTR